MRRLQIVLAAVATLAATDAAAQGTSFDGAWNVTLACPPHNGDEDAKGYIHRFPGEVADGQTRDPRPRLRADARRLRRGQLFTAATGSRSSR